MGKPYLKNPGINRLYLFSWVLLCLGLTSCAYRMGSTGRVLPGGYRQVAVPIFKNYSQEPGIEVNYTNALIQEFERSKVAKVVESYDAGALVEGEILNVTYVGESPVSNTGALPRGAVLASSYRIIINARITVKKQSDKSVLWKGEFNAERSYTAPQVFQAGLNTVNPLYNLSARRQNINVMATEMMSEAHDRLTENF